MLWIFLSVLPWGIIHSFLASKRAKDMARHFIGAGADRYYRLIYNIFACLSLLPILGVLILTPDHQLYLVPMPWSILMVAGQLLAAAGLLIGFRQTDVREFLGLRQASGSSAERCSDAPLATKQGKLIVDGLYRYVRHPLYSAGLVFIWLMPLMTVNVLSINISLTIYVIVGAFFEERKLMQEYGQDYADYAAVTPMLIPIPRWNKGRYDASM
jgi:protein-S-isoprenylcysteine O-methyltransferase Ste14